MSASDPPALHALVFQSLSLRFGRVPHRLVIGQFVTVEKLFLITVTHGFRSLCVVLFASLVVENIRMDSVSISWAAKS